MMKKLIYILLILIPLLSASGCRDKEDPDATRDLFYTEFRNVDKLVLAQMTVSKMATIDDLKPDQANGLRQNAEAVLDALKIGDRVAAYSYDTYLQAYVDMSRLGPEDVTVDGKSKRVTVMLPEIVTEFAGRDVELREDHYRVTGLRSDISAKERAALKERMNDHLRQEVERDDNFRRQLEAKAREKGKAYFEALARTAGYTAVVEFR